MQIYREFHFEAAHRLPHVPVGHKCARLHGHSYRVKVVVDGALDAHMGWVMDFAVLKEKAAPIINALDHQYLNEIEGLANPTSEHIAKWLWQRLKPILPELVQLEIQETCTSGCVYRGEDA